MILEIILVFYYEDTIYWIMLPQNSYTESVTSNMTTFGDQVSKR